ncbi:MAG: DUF5926 family protein [Dermatophilaceae bacterium]|nr:DUF5926 family protein [Intrasporangiaceae bacterium]
MGKASRRRQARQESRDSAPKRQRTPQVPFMGRPFEGLAGETEWVAIREILPAATGTITLTGGGAPEGVTEATVATVLPLAWAGLHRESGEILIGTQSGGASGDASRDLVSQLLATAAVPPGAPVPAVPQPTIDTPRLQDVVDQSAPFRAEVHEGFEFWVGDAELEGEAQDSLERANATVVPTVRLGEGSAFWCRIGERTYVRIVLPEDEDTATNALARLHAAGEDALGDDTRLLGAFRACGLLIPVVEIDPEVQPADYEQPLLDWQERYAVAAARDESLSPDERRAKSGLLSRQVTLR